jgi:uroporphyrinogen-III decarboxylase
MAFGLVMAQNPYDFFADMMRGTKGIARDMFRQPEKLHEAMDFHLKMTLSMIKNIPMSDCPVCTMPLHKGDDTFMSDKQFEEYYWPGLRAIMMAMVEEGLVPMPFAEGKYTKRLKQIADTPKTAVAWWFDQTDMAEAKRIIGDRCCIMGNIPTSIIKTGTTAQVKSYCKDLIETCAPGGGFILSGGAAIDNGNMENLKAIMESAYEYGTY